MPSEPWQNDSGTCHERDAGIAGTGVSGGTFFLFSLFGATAAYIAYLVHGRQFWSVIGTLFTFIALFALSVGLVIRGIRAGHWPLANRFEFTLCWIWALLVFYLLSEHAMGTPSAGAFVLPLALVLALWTANRSVTEQLIRPLTPALQTNWFPLHVGCSAVAYGAFSVAGGVGIMFLLSEWLRQRGFAAADHAGRYPSAQRTEYHIWRAVGLGFPWLTLGMLVGAIWAQVAWGRYWDWDPKENWTLVIWLTYLILLHGRALQGWRGRRVAWLAVIGLAAVLFTFFGAGWLLRTLRLESVHIF
jgi:cytochrome c-type biogenesis protein CcsB